MEKSNTRILRSTIGITVLLFCLSIIVGCANSGNRMADAIMANDLQTVKRLVAKYPDSVNAVVDRNDIGWKSSVLMLAVENDRYVIVDYLIRAGAKIDVKDTMKRTPLQVAVYNKNTRMVLLLLSAGASPNMCDIDNGTVLHHSASNGNRDIVKILLSYGADPSLIDRYGKKPIDYALKNGFQDTAKLLYKAMK